MSSGEDPEKLLAEALRAQAASTALPEKPDEPETEVIEDRTDEHRVDEHRAQVSGYGLLSGSRHLGYTQPEDTEQVDPTRARAGQTAALRSHRRIGVGVILLLALVLGLAAGAVVGLVTLL